MTDVTGKPTQEDISRGRVEALGDGVFAIVVTLLVLEIKVPHIEAHNSLTELAAALQALAPKFLSWAISFVTVCVIWLNHHRLLKLTSRIDNAVFRWNANLLLWTSFIPFPTALMGDYPTDKLAVSLVWGPGPEFDVAGSIRVSCSTPQFSQGSLSLSDGAGLVTLPHAEAVVIVAFIRHNSSRDSLQ
jgi:Endosomal/lysosomal potassium channel TMEM175